MRKKKYILVLSGGGAKGAFQAGALQYIFKHGFYHGQEHIKGEAIHFDYIAGVSAGSLNAVMIAMDQQKNGKQTERLLQLWNEIAGNPEKVWTSDFVEDTGEGIQPKKGLFQKVLPKINFWKGLGLIFSKKKRKRLEQDAVKSIKSIKAFASNDPLKKQLEAVVDIRDIKNTILQVGSVSLDSGQYQSIKHTDVIGNNDAFIQAILASTSMPVIWPPVKSIGAYGKDHTNLVDGGIRNVSPLGDIIDNIQADHKEDTDYHVVIINNHEGKVAPLKDEELNFLNIAKRSLVDISLNEIFINDIREFMRVNRLVHQVEEAKIRREIPEAFELRSRNSQQVFRKFYYKEIRPEVSIGTTLDFSKDEVENRLDHGYQMARKAFGPYEGGITHRTPDTPPSNWQGPARRRINVSPNVDTPDNVAPEWDV